MRVIFMVMLMFFSGTVLAQLERDTLLKRCPVYITDTITSNNFFLEFQPSTLKVDRVRGNLTIVLQQRDQYFSLFFHDNKLKNSKYTILRGSSGKTNVEAKYSFRAGEQVSFVDVRSGTVEAIFDPEKGLWHLKVSGTIANLVERTVTYYRVRAEFYFP
jgi:hypothetical protein